ncbi:hypothetical protein [Micromonospora sp. NPDC093277]|uniref:hypothetical protein n=1 Tax=Micromonospora sp. NPDC093277 TaxID=3364291 RepID=UPI00380D39EE
MSFGLVVLAVDPGATDVAVRAMAERCRSLHHPEGELDERIVGFYENLRAHYPDFPPYAHDCPWMDMPLNVDIDHVSMHLSFSERSTPALQLIDQLASRYNLTIYDPQGDEVTRPTDVRAPMDPAIVALIEEFGAPDR